MQESDKDRRLGVIDSVAEWGRPVSTDSEVDATEMALCLLGVSNCPEDLDDLDEVPSHRCPMDPLLFLGGVFLLAEAKMSPC